VRDISPFNFGLVVAYLVPGFVIVWGASYYSTTVRAWLSVPAGAAPTVGGLFYATLASLAAGMIVSALRWAIIDTIHHATGIAEPLTDFSRLPEKLAAFQAIVEDHYRYFQHYGNMLLALTFTYGARRSAVSGWAHQWGAMDIAFALVCVFLFLGSRDALRRYYRKVGELLKPCERG